MTAARPNMPGWIVLILILAPLGCGSTNLERGRGLYWNYDAERLEREGYPDRQHDYSSREWGVLTDENGIAYGPRSYFEGKLRLEHPHLQVTDEFLESRWLRLYRSDCCTEALLGHFLEICDLAWYELTDLLQYKPDVKIEMYSPADIEEYRRIAAREYWVTHMVAGNSIVFESVKMLFQRTLAGHAVWAAMADAFLDLKCHGRIPPWFREGLSSYVAEEGFEHLSFMAEFRPKREILVAPEEMEQHVFPLIDRENGRIARYNAFLMVWHLSETYGFERIQQLLGHVERGETFEEALQAVYGMSYKAFLAMLDPRKLGEPTITRPPR